MRSIVQLALVRHKHWSVPSKQQEMELVEKSVEAKEGRWTATVQQWFSPIKGAGKGKENIYFYWKRNEMT